MRLLLVEDDDDIALVVNEALAVDGHAVDRAATGLDGLWMAREGDYGLIVLDILLPGMNGYEVCRTLREEDGRDTPVLMLTAKVGEYDETDGFEMGADDYLRKPFAPAVLRARVQALLRRAPSPRRDPILARGGITLDPASRRCTRDGDEVELTGRQAQLLEALLQAEDTPVSRLDLVRSVWGHDFDGDPNVADVYLRYLRAKLGRDTVENVRGAGYRIRAS